MVGDLSVLDLAEPEIYCWICGGPDDVHPFPTGWQEVSDGLFLGVCSWCEDVERGGLDTEDLSQVRSDGRTVWVDMNGFTVGRFSAFGIDIHTADSSGCIDCTHEQPDASGWTRFVTGMREHHGVEVDDEHMPDYLR